MSVLAPYYRLSVAPMMDWTDRFYRRFMRILTRRTLLYTEMIHVNAILKGDKDRFLKFHPKELPLALQLGGDNPEALAIAARIGEDLGYSEINLNVGCPSDRVVSGNFGACLMANPEHVAQIVSTLRRSVQIPVTVKHRIGIPGKESIEDLLNFVSHLKAATVSSLSIHARIAVLGGLSPAENRSIPPLRYSDVYEVKAQNPELPIVINGGIRDWSSAKEHLTKTDGVMIGRMAYESPFSFAEVDKNIWGEKENPIHSRKQVLIEMETILEEFQKEGIKPHQVLRHTLGLFHGVRGGRYYRRYLSENMHKVIDGRPLLTHLINKQSEWADSSDFAEN